MRVSLGRVIQGSKSDAILGTSDRAKIIDTISRAIELAADRANWDIWVDNLDICSDGCGVVTLPSFVDTVLQVNVGGYPTVFRSPWFQFHINGPGNECGPCCGFSDDLGMSPIFQDLKEWSIVAVICEDAIDGNGTLEAIIEGETKDTNLNTKMAITIPVTGPSTSGIKIPLLFNVANTPTNPLVYFRKITRITLPVTRGYKKIIAFPIRQMAQPVTLGYYAPNETMPMYRRIKVACSCKWVRVRYRRADIPFVDDWQILPIASYQAMMDLLKSIRLSDSNNIDQSEAYLAKAVRLLTEIQGRSAAYTPLQVDPSWSAWTPDWR